MGRRLTIVLAGALAVTGSLTGCSSEEPVAAAPTKKTLDPAMARQIDDLIIPHLNNENIHEKYRNDLVEYAKLSDESRRYTIDRLLDEVKKGQASKGAPGTLRGPGRRRAMEVLDQVGGDDPAALEGLQAGMKDDAEVRAAAAAAMVARGNEDAFLALATVLRDAREDAVAREKAIAAIARYAKPERREKLLDTLDESNRASLASIVLATYPEKDPAARAAELRKVAGTHKNPSARAFAIEALAAVSDSETRALAWKALDDGIPVARPVALAALAGLPPADATKDLAKVLERDPPDADEIARRIFKLNASETVGLCAALLEDGARAPAVRAAVAREVLGHMADAQAPPALRGDGARERALPALRRAARDKNDVVGKAAVEAIGRIGGESDAEALLLLLSEPGIDRSADVVRALGAIGGPAAAGKIVSLLKDPNLRPVARDVLVAWKERPAFPGFDLIELLSAPEADVRAAAFAALKAANGGDGLGYDPAAADSTVTVKRWLDWWKQRRSKQG
jgi:HEAT repeat protein